MNIKNLQKNWNRFGEDDPLWAILTHPDKRNNQWQLEEFFEIGKREIAGVLHRIERLRVPLRQDRALDFGCGVGRLTQALCTHFGEVHGVDIAASMIEKARELNQFGDQCHYHHNTVDHLPLFQDNTFDLIYTNITLQHMKPRYAFSYLREFYRILRPGGMMVFQIPSEPPPQLAWIYRYVPEPMLNLARRFRHRSHAVMEMHVIHERKMRAFLDKLGAELVDLQTEGSSGVGWVSFRYFVRK